MIIAEYTQLLGSEPAINAMALCFLTSGLTNAFRLCFRFFIRKFELDRGWRLGCRAMHEGGPTSTHQSSRNTTPRRKRRRAGSSAPCYRRETKSKIIRDAGNTRCINATTGSGDHGNGLVLLHFWFHERFPGLNFCLHLGVHGLVLRGQQSQTGRMVRQPTAHSSSLEHINIREGGTSPG